VANAPSWHDILPFIGQVEADEEIVALAAHGAKHERSLIGHDISGGLPWICTYKVALRLWPEFPSHSNQSIRYSLNPPGLSREIAHPAHRAYPDAYVTAFTLITALNLGYSIDTLVEWSNDVAWLPRCKIGDYRNGGKGTPWPEVETSMLHWILRKDFDVDTVAAVKRELERREIDQREERELAELNSQLRTNGMTEIDRFERPRYEIHADGKPAEDFTETDKRDREHPTTRPVDNLELPL
jgi:exodeoxyribonuclease X